MGRRAWGWLVVALIAAGCSGTTIGPIITTSPPAVPGSSTSAVASAETVDNETPTAAPATAAFNDITLKGKGKKVAKFKKPADTAAIAILTHSGKENFIVHSIDSSGETIKGLVNEIGKYKGTVLFDENDGDNSVAFSIDADGAWTITIKPVTSARPWNPSTPLKGAGDDVIRVNPPSSGLVTLDLVYKGKSNFIVHAYSSNGFDGLANEIGNFSGQVLLPDGTVLLEVEASGGTWTATPG